MMRIQHHSCQPWWRGGSPSPTLTTGRLIHRSRPCTATMAHDAARIAEAEQAELLSPSMLLGPAAQATLRMLDWRGLCEQLADFSSTHVGRRACLELAMPPTLAESETMLEDTR